METDWRVREAVAGNPLQWGHALLSVETHGTDVIHEGQARLQWGHALLSVETPVKKAQYKAESCGFNGATLF